MKKSISRTRGNAYRKIDQCHFMVHPRYSEVPRTSFLEVRKLTLSDSHDEAIIAANVDVAAILDEIAHEEF